MKKMENKILPDGSFDLVVIGGGSGGLAAAKEASRLGARVAVFDFVRPSPQGSRWGLGGTCVNVGCVPKKLMHYAGQMKSLLHEDAPKLGWRFASSDEVGGGKCGGGVVVKHDWNELVVTVQNYIKSLNFYYRAGLTRAGVIYINSLAKFVDKGCVEYVPKGRGKGEGKVTVYGRYFLIATGCRPTIPVNIPGALEFAITSDDLFSLARVPGKTLLIGGSYIALECAGLLTELGFEVTVAVRSILLRGFDCQSAEKVGALMEATGTIFKRAVTVLSLKRANDSKRIVVQFSDKSLDEYDTVIYAIGRTAETSELGLDAAGVLVDPITGKIPAVCEKTNVDNIYAVGDVLDGRLELTPVAIKAGEYLSRRLFGNSHQQMDYTLVPTTVFTPFEYGFVGKSEEEAIMEFGREKVTTYLFEFMPLELSAVHREKALHAFKDETDLDLPPVSLSKLICLKEDNDRVLGLHFIGRNAGEIVQGFAVAIRLGARKSDFDETVGIHPTDAESFTALNVTRESKQNWVASGGCGGGKCG